MHAAVPDVHSFISTLWVIVSVTAFQMNNKPKHPVVRPSPEYPALQEQL